MQGLLLTLLLQCRIVLCDVSSDCTPWLSDDSLSASSMHLTFAPSLLMVSMYSSSSTLSKTMPPPARQLYAQTLLVKLTSLQVHHSILVRHRPNGNARVQLIPVKVKSAHCPCVDASPLLFEPRHQLNGLDLRRARHRPRREDRPERIKPGISYPSQSVRDVPAHLDWSSRRIPLIWLVMWITWLNFSRRIRSSTLTVSGLHTRLTSLRARSTSMMCSARSFSDASNSSPSLVSSVHQPDSSIAEAYDAPSRVLPLRTVPAIAWLYTFLSSTLHSVSGLAPTICTSPQFR